MTLAEAVKEYKDSGRIILQEMKRFYEQMSIQQAIENAAVGKMPSGKMNSHQHRVGYVNGKVAAKQLLDHIDKIKACKSFEEIFEITEVVRKETYKLGDLWSYDTALRIGFNLKKYPLEVYVQCGVVNGVRKVFNSKRPKGRSLPLSQFPKEIQELRPYEAENFLCHWGKQSKRKAC